jgi:hypothetical protein
MAFQFLEQPQRRRGREELQGRADQAPEIGSQVVSFLMYRGHRGDSRRRTLQERLSHRGKLA